MDKGQKSILIGLLLNSMGIIVKYLDIFYIILPDFLKGFLEGFFMSLGVILILIGVYYESGKSIKIRSFKKKVFHKISNK